MIFLSYMMLLQVAPSHATCTSSIQETALTRHSYRDLISGDMLTCYQHCRNDGLCQSINFHRHNGVCELNNRTKTTRPGNFQPTSGAFYLSNPFRAQLGSSDKIPAISCLEIKTSFNEAASGRYWLTQPGGGRPRNVFCDMTIVAVVECTGNPCKQGACLYQGSGQYTCSCNPGYEGRHCEIDIDECSSQPCLNGGRCSDGVNSFECNCTGGFTGPRCELNPAPECNAYSQLSSADRSVNVQNGVMCDKTLSTAWYRFTGDAGIKMPNWCVPRYKCSTHASGWLNGTHPTPEEGLVSRQVCFHWNSNCCNWQKTIHVRNCGAFTIYKLVGTVHCKLRYCATL